MPRAFLIKSKKERKKAEGGDEKESKNQEQVDSFQDSLEARMASSDGASQVSEPQSTSDVRPEVENAVKTQTEGKTAVSEENQHNPIPRGKTKAKKALKEVQIYEALKCKKPRKRAPKRSSIYYYNDESDEASDESEIQEGSCVPSQRCHSRNDIPNAHNYHSSSSAVNCKDSSEAERTNSESYCFARQPQQSRCQENSTKFEFDKTVAQQVPREENKPQLPRFVDDKENQINEGLHNVKIVEYHSISSNIEIVYPDIPRPPENPVPENHNAEKYYHVQSSPTVPSTPASQTQNGEAGQAVVSSPNPAPVAQQPVIHYVPVFAVQGPNGVYYEPVPGAPHVVQNGPPAPYGSPQPGHPQPVQQPPEQVVAQPHSAPQQLPPHSVPQQLPPHSVPQQLPPHQLMQPVQSHQVPPQQQVSQPQPQPQLQPLQQGTAMHRQRLPSQPGTPPYPVPQPYNPPTSIHSAGVVYSQQPQAMPYPMESPPYAKPVQVTPGLPYPPSTQVAMATKAYPVPATVQAPAPTPVPQPYAVPPQGGHAAMQYPPYPPSSQSAAMPQLYPAQEYPPATQSQVLQHYPHMPTQPHPRQPLQGAVTGQPYPLQPQRGGPAAQMYQPSQVSPPYPHSAAVVVTQQPYPANKTSPVPAASYPAPSRGPAQFAPPGNPPHTSQASYYPPKTVTVPSQPHPSVRPALLPAQVYPENRNGIPPPQYMPRESEPKFVYAPPPVNFHQSPIYRVPEQSKSAQAAPTPANDSHDKTVTGSRRRKASVPHRGMRDIPTPPDSYAEQPSPQGGPEKSECHNSPLNKSSCIITPPGSPQDKVQNGEVETYTVVVHDRGIQTRLPEMEPRWCPTKRLWKMEPKRLPAPAQQHQQPQPLVESGKGLKVDVPPQNGSLSPAEYSPTQKENMYIPREHSMNTQRPHGMRRGKGRKSSSRYHCKFCSKGFQWHSHLTSHERTHTGEKPYQCSECSRAFTRADGLQCHMIVHNKKKPFKCQYCGKGFSDNTLLEKHVYSHTGVKPFKCEYCGRAFTDSQSIEKHLLVHTGTKPYKCQYCVRSFNDSQMLVRHIRSHTGEKPYKCHHCPMAFSKQSALVIHTRVHTGEKPYKCPNCPKSFSISGNLQRHILIHTGERPYKCSKCPKAFNNPSHLSRHISKLHAPKALEKNSVAVPMETDTIKVEMTN